MNDLAEDDAVRDCAAEAWLITRHKPGWYIGEATASEWIDAYTAVDENGCAVCGSNLHFTNEHLNPGES